MTEDAPTTCIIPSQARATRRRVCIGILCQCLRDVSIDLQVQPANGNVDDPRLGAS
jgi:hypothetical protein